jgi:hypothetical protein
VHIARDDNESWASGVLLGSFDHRGEQEEGQERGGEMVDLKAAIVMPCQRVG